MCNLYRMTKGKDEVAKWFEALNDAAQSNAGGEVYPGYPGLVIAEGKLRQMTWGFPLVMKGRNGQPLKPRPVNNARTDKLRGPFWKASFVERRCLIPLTAWAEAEGPKGGKTRTWLSRPDAEMFAAGGIWRWSEEWGEVYSMVMTDAAGAAAEVHSRMPVLITQENRSVWLEGPPDKAFALCQPYGGQLSLDRTDDPWVARRTSGG